jgi:integrase
MNSLRQNEYSGFETTVEDAAVQWLAWMRDYRKRSLLTIRAYTQTLAAFHGFVGTRFLGAVTYDDVELFVGRPRRGGMTPAAATVNRDLVALRSFFQWCVNKNLLADSPAALVHGPPIKNRQPRPIPDGVWVQWWDGRLPESLRLALGLGFFGGLRRAEIVALTSDQMQDGKIVNFVRKGGGEHSLPLADMIEIVADRHPQVAGKLDLFWAALAERKRHDGKLLGWRLPGPDEMNRRISTYARRNDLPLFTPHQLRHSAATNLVRSGVPIHLVAGLMNHSDVKMTMRYVASGGEQLSEWKRTLNDNG